MITVRRAEARHHERARRRDTWLSFDPSLAEGFGVLDAVGEYRLPCGASVPRRPHRAVESAAEIVTYVREGTLAYEDSFGRAGVIQAGEFEHLLEGGAFRHNEANASRTDGAHVFRIWLHLAIPALDAGRQQKRFSAAERRGGFRTVASFDGRQQSLRLHQDAVVYSALLEPGQHVVHELAPQRVAWLHVIGGDADVGGIILTGGDSVGLAGERSVSLTAQGPTELLLLDLADRPHGP